MTGEASAFTGSAIEIAFKNAQAAVILLTGDDLARVGRRYLSPHDEPYEKILTSQARPNVLFEAGMAFGLYHDEHPTRLRGTCQDATHTFRRCLDLDCSVDAARKASKSLTD